MTIAQPSRFLVVTGAVLCGIAGGVLLALVVQPEFGSVPPHESTER